MKKETKGITLISLIITIIIMLILVGVTIALAVNSDLFDNAYMSTQKTNNAIVAEQNLEKINVDGVIYDNIVDFMQNKPSLIPGSYDLQGKLIKNWEDLKKDKDIKFGYEGHENIDNYIGAGAYDDSYLTEVSSSIEHLVIDGSQVKVLSGSVFYNNDVIKTVKITEGLETIGFKCFYGSDSIEEVLLPNSLKVVGQGAFQQSTIKSGRIYKDVVYSKNTYYACPQLENIVIDEGVTTITENMIRNCVSLKKVIIPASVTSIGSMAFRDCDRLEELYILSEDLTIDSGAIQKISNETGERCDLTIYVVNETMKQRCEALAKGNINFTVQIIENEIN